MGNREHREPPPLPPWVPDSVRQLLAEDRASWSGRKFKPPARRIPVRKGSVAELLTQERR